MESRERFPQMKVRQHVDKIRWEIREICFSTQYKLVLPPVLFIDFLTAFGRRKEIVQVILIHYI